MKPSCRGPSSHGVALVVTLMMLAVVTMMVVGLAGVMRNETAAARNLTYQVLAEQLADIGAQQGMAALLSNTTAGAAATGPGWVLRINPGSGNPSPLTVLATSNAGTNVDLNRMGTNSVILSMTNPDRATWATVQASWTNLELPGTTAGNRVIGRFAWWIDDEGAKANLNASAGTNTNYFPLHHPFPLFAPRVFARSGTGTNDWVYTNFMPRSNYLLTVESLKETNVVLRDTNVTNRFRAYHSNKGHITVWSSNVDLNPWGQPKVSLSELTNPAVVTDPVSFSNLMARTFAHPELRTLFGRDFVDKYGAGDRALGSNVIRQTLANAYEAISFQPANPLGTQAPLSSAGTTTNIPTQYMGLTPSTVLLNELAVGAAVATNAQFNLQIQVWVVAELVTAGNATNIPLDQTVTIFTVTNNGIRVVGGKKNGVFIGSFGGFYGPGPTIVSNAPPRRSASPVPRNGFKADQTWACFEYTWGPGRGNGPLSITGPTEQLTIEVDIPDVVLRQRFGTNLLVTDWFINPGIPRMAPLRFSFDTGAGAGGSTMPITGTVPDPSFTWSMQPARSPPGGLSYLGVSKADPRAREFSGWGNIVGVGPTQWTSVPSTTNGENTRIYDSSTMLGTFGGLLKDRFPTANPSATNEGKIWTPNTNWYRVSNASVASWGAAGSNFPTVGTLGQLHTGLAWRTLRLLSQSDRASASRDPDPPDWFLYELFTAATNPSAAAPRVNLNSRMYSRGAAATNRLPVALALLATLMDSTTVIRSGLFATNLIQPWQNTEMTYASNSMTTNNLRWGAGSTWANTRRTRLNVTNTDVFLFGSELAELDGVGNVGRSDEENEAILMAAADLVTARSDTFSVWSAGQALAVQQGTGRTNVMGEVRRQTVFQRVPRIEGGRVTGYDLQVLYSRNHAVE